MQEYNNTDRQLHWLSQVIASTFVPEQTDDSHTNLYFDGFSSGIIGRWIDSPAGKIILYLDLESMSFKWKDYKLTILDEVSVFNKGLIELGVETGKKLHQLGMKTEGLDMPMHFEIPDYGIHSLNKGDISTGGLKSWMFYREMANLACFEMLGYLQSTSEIRIWPHHFDTGIYTLVSEQLGMGFGLAIEDPMIGEPYFYLAGYSSGSTINYNQLFKLSAGRWETDAHWKGAVLPLNEVPGSSNTVSLQVIRKFIADAASWYLKNQD